MVELKVQVYPRSTYPPYEFYCQPKSKSLDFKIITFEFEP